MARINRFLAGVVLFLGVVSLIVGTVFIAQGVAKANMLKGAMQLEQVTLSIEESAIAEGEIIDSAEEAQAAGDAIREHRRGIAPTYEDLLAGGRFDPTNPNQLSYAQALNMENYLWGAPIFSTTYNERLPAFSIGCLTSFTWFFS